MEYRIKREVSYEWITYIEADNEEDALQKAYDGDCEWEQEDTEPYYNECIIDEDYSSEDE